MGGSPTLHFGVYRGLASTIRAHGTPSTRSRLPASWGSLGSQRNRDPGHRNHAVSISRFSRTLDCEWKATCSCRFMRAGFHNMTTTIPSPNQPDVVLIGAGIMSATLAVILKELDPDLKIEIYEVLGSEAQESSNAWNNAGTGHAALCELNYTPPKEDGSIDISNALNVNTEFDLSRQLWAYLTLTGAIKDPQSFLHSVPHCSFVRGSDNVAFLKKRYDTLTAHHCYQGMEYSGDKKQIQEWMTLVM